MERLDKKRIIQSYNKLIKKRPRPLTLLRITNVALASATLASAISWCQRAKEVSEYETAIQGIVSQKVLQGQGSSEILPNHLNERTELAAFNSKIDATLNFMDQSDLLVLSKMSLKLRQQIVEKSLSISPLESWREGAIMDLVSNEENMRYSIGLNTDVFLTDKLSLESASTLLYAMGRKMEILSQTVKTYQEKRGVDLKTAIGEIAKNPNFGQMDATINSLAWRDALENVYFKQQISEKESEVGNIAKFYEECKKTENFYSCWDNFFMVPERPTIANMNLATKNL